MHTLNFKEQNLVILLSGGEEAAFEELYYLYSPRLLGFLIKLVKSQSHASELLQDVFIKIWNNRQTIDPAQSFRSYLFRIAENAVYDFYRKASRDQKLQAELVKMSVCEYRHVEESLFYKENEELLQHVIEALPPKRRQVFRLIKIEERSYEEVSTLLNISPSTISDHIVKATKFVHERLKRWHATAMALLGFFIQNIWN
jgi:RNA polymerase sigma-70 factor (ECF subfamily)